MCWCNWSWFVVFFFFRTLDSDVRIGCSWLCDCFWKRFGHILIGRCRWHQQFHLLGISGRHQFLCFSFLICCHAQILGRLKYSKCKSKSLKWIWVLYFKLWQRIFFSFHKNRLTILTSHRTLPAHWWVYYNRYWFIWHQFY